MCEGLGEPVPSSTRYTQYVRQGDRRQIQLIITCAFILTACVSERSKENGCASEQKEHNQAKDLFIVINVLQQPKDHVRMRGK